MTVTLNLSPEQEQGLRREALARGVDAADLLKQMLLDNLARGEAPPPTAPPRIPGLHAGQTCIRDDFDAPLPDSFRIGLE